MLNPDYKDMLLALSGEKVEYLLVGAYAMAAHGYSRTTADMDIWVNPAPDNARAVIRALQSFGAPLDTLTEADLLKPDTVFQVGVSPLRIDILTGLTGLRYESARVQAVQTAIDGVPVNVLSLGDLVRNKKATGRTRDIADAEALEALRVQQSG